MAEEIHLFGMDDPTKVVEQLRRYVGDGRLEIAEVMAEELCAMLLADKKRDLTRQRLLVEGLRDHASILEIRGKWKKSIRAGKQRDSERSRLAGQLSRAGDVEGAAAVKGLRSSDSNQTGRSHLGNGRLGPALSAFKSARRGAKHNLEGSLRPLEAHEKLKGHLRRAGKAAKQLDAALAAAGPVNLVGGEFVLMPEGDSTHSLERLLLDLERWCDPALGLPAAKAAALEQRAGELRRQMESIASGEQAANARLQTAIDSLEPVVDYHEYSQSSRSP
jgi:hypothetical protein